MNSGGPAEGKRMVAMVLYLTGAAFIIAGFMGLSSPSFISEVLDIDHSMAMTVAGVLIIVGLTDLALARFVFNPTERK